MSTSPSRSPLRQNNRVISASTGLCKLQLSPKRQPQEATTRYGQKSPKSPKTKSKPLLQVEAAQPEPTKNELLSKLAQKQAKLTELENQAELVRFELLEIQAQLKETYEPKDSALNGLSRKVSTIFSAPQAPQLRKTASKVFNTETTMLKQKASQIFNNNRFFDDVKRKMDKQQADFEELTKKGQDFARNFLGMAKPKENSTNAADSSFVLDNLDTEQKTMEKSILLSEEDSLIDIDDYDSDYSR
ncbi:hypothetical_protein [Candidozyma auris]|uniref:hypothetical_protein n=1 Tax=Candidozyma auris TaxID=498019 RepID=UPI000D2AEBF0|nr:hypothetical_protein [[Candida] auris]QEO24463.1 hypothetical_protein [[Candida] auris]GBL52292.1 hypothetical protein CAJCM15448_45660 [[Candida] auris]